MKNILTFLLLFAATYPCAVYAQKTCTCICGAAGSQENCACACTTAEDLQALDQEIEELHNLGADTDIELEEGWEETDPNNFETQDPSNRPKHLRIKQQPLTSTSHLDSCCDNEPEYEYAYDYEDDRPHDGIIGETVSKADGCQIAKNTNTKSDTILLGTSLFLILLFLTFYRLSQKKKTQKRR